MDDDELARMKEAFAAKGGKPKVLPTGNAGALRVELGKQRVHA